MNILLADDHGLFRDSMATWLMQLGGKINIQHASNFDDVITVIKSNKQPDLILLDLYMPRMQGSKSVSKLHKLAKHIPIAIVSADENPDIIKRCIHAGATGYLPKSSDGQVILAAIRIILAGGSYIPSTAINNESLLPRFNNKQHQILVLLTQGVSNKEIAYRIDLAEGTVKQYISDILKKLNVHNRTQACIKAKEMLNSYGQ